MMFFSYCYLNQSVCSVFKYKYGHWSPYITHPLVIYVYNYVGVAVVVEWLFSRKEFRCTIRVDEPCPVCSPRIDLSLNGRALHIT